MEVFVKGFQLIFSDPYTILLLIGGNLFGIVFGCIPGLTATLGVILMIPFTYGMSASQGLTLLVSVFVGGISGGLIAACTINIPGTPSSIITTFDGYPMAKQGKPAVALSIGVFCSMLGGMFSALVLIFVAPPVARIALKFGSWECFCLALMGLSVVISMCTKNVAKGIIGVLFGLALASIGLDGISGVKRLTFNKWELAAGLNETAVLMGFFAIAEIVNQTHELGKKKNKVELGRFSFLPPLKEMKDCGIPIVLGSIYGTFIGIIPAIGQNTATLITYNHTKALSKHPEKFGTGYAPGIAASETANNAVNGGALIPLITLGIPGDMTTAAMLGGLLIHGLQPGPRLYTDHPEVVGAIMCAYFCANIVMYILEQGLMRGFVRILDVNMSNLFPVILTCCILGVYTINNRMFDVRVMILFALLGFFLQRIGMDLICPIMGFILGKLVEKHLRTGLAMSNGSFMGIFDSKIATAFLIVAFVFLAAPLISRLFKEVINPMKEANSKQSI